MAEVKQYRVSKIRTYIIFLLIGLIAGLAIGYFWALSTPDIQTSLLEYQIERQDFISQ